MTRPLPRRFGATLVAGLSIALLPMAGSSQTAKPPAGANGDLRSLYATAPDILEGKRLADVSCTRCHGANGISPSAGVPNIAAQRPPYVYMQLRAYLQGSRPQSPMTGAVKWYCRAALTEVAG